RRRRGAGVGILTTAKWLGGGASSGSLRRVVIGVLPWEKRVRGRLTDAGLLDRGPELQRIRRAERAPSGTDVGLPTSGQQQQQRHTHSARAPESTLTDEAGRKSCMRREPSNEPPIEVNDARSTP